jgi:antitoxin component of MazEF toxin-antitoxin module
MPSFDTTLKQWGNSLAVTIPAELVKKQRLRSAQKVRVLIIPDNAGVAKAIWGTATKKIDTDKAMRIIDGDED